jgi:hypothetical protein
LRVDSNPSLETSLVQSQDLQQWAIGLGMQRDAIIISVRGVSAFLEEHGGNAEMS